MPSKEISSLEASCDESAQILQQWYVYKCMRFLAFANSFSFLAIIVCSIMILFCILLQSSCLHRHLKRVALMSFIACCPDIFFDDFLSAELLSSLPPLACIAVS